MPELGEVNTNVGLKKIVEGAYLIHFHPDHIGSAAAIVRETGATTYMHGLDAPFAEADGPFRPMNPAPGLLPRTAYPFVWRPQERMEAVRMIATWQMEKRCQSPAGCMSLLRIAKTSRLRD